MGGLWCGGVGMCTDEQAMVTQHGRASATSESWRRHGVAKGTQRAANCTRNARMLPSSVAPASPSSAPAVGFPRRRFGAGPAPLSSAPPSEALSASRRRLSS